VGFPISSREEVPGERKLVIWDDDKDDDDDDDDDDKSSSRLRINPVSLILKKDFICKIQTAVIVQTSSCRKTFEFQHSLESWVEVHRHRFLQNK
jgi:hypothetical protein